MKIVTWTFLSSWIIRLASLTTNLITKPYHKDWNHPPNILKQSTKLMEKGNTILLSNEIIFNGLTLMISYLTAGFKGDNLLDKRTKYKLKNCNSKDWRHKSISSI